jgi:hypothetical protein
LSLFQIIYSFLKKKKKSFFNKNPALRIDFLDMTLVVSIQKRIGMHVSILSGMPYFMLFPACHRLVWCWSYFSVDSFFLEVMCDTR